MNGDKRQDTREDFFTKPFTYHCSNQTITSPEAKRKIDKKKFGNPHNHTPKKGTIKDIVDDLMRGHEVIPVEFGLIEGDDVIRRRKTHWKSQEIIMLDVDYGTEQF